MAGYSKCLNFVFTIIFQVKGGNVKSIFRVIGLVFLVGGIAAAFNYSFNFETSVAVTKFGIKGLDRVHNLALASQQQNGIILSIGAAIIGCFLIYLGRNTAVETAPSGKQCPYCAEMIKLEAILCRHCGKDIEREIVTEHHDVGNLNEQL